MKKKYVIAQKDMDWSKDRWVNKGPGGLPFYTLYFEYPKKEGYIPLWDRNAQKFAWFKIIKQLPTALAYLTERGGCPLYWQSTLAKNMEEIKL